MKLHFEPDLDYQKLAIDSVADLFRGQEINRTEFTVTRAAPIAFKSSLPPSHTTWHTDPYRGATAITRSVSPNLRARPSAAPVGPTGVLTFARGPWASPGYEIIFESRTLSRIKFSGHLRPNDATQMEPSYSRSRRPQISSR